MEKMGSWRTGAKQGIRGAVAVGACDHAWLPRNRSADPHSTANGLWSSAGEGAYGGTFHHSHDLGSLCCFP